VQGVFNRVRSEVNVTTKEVVMATKSNNPYGCRGKPGGPRGGGDLRVRKAMEGIPASMFEVISDERYWKNVKFLGARYREVSCTKGREYGSNYFG